MSFSRPGTARSPLFNLASPPLLSPTVIRNRARRGSLVKVEEVGNNTLEDSQDQGAFPDHNSEWVNRKGSFTRHPLHELVSLVSRLGLIHRRMAYASISHPRWQIFHRYDSRS
jgi:hypothetical protein